MIYIALDNFQIRVHEVLKPILRSVPFVIEKNNLITAINDIAKKRNIQIGNTLQEVQRKIFGLVREKENVKRTNEFSNEFYAILLRHTNTIEPERPAGAYLDCDNVHSVYEMEYKIESIKKQIQHELEIPVKIGIASNKITAKLAAEIASPSETIHIRFGHEKKFIASLPISLLPGIGRRTMLVLLSLGITTIGAFCQLPENEVSRLFGEKNIFLHRLANGVDDRKIQTPSKIHSISKTFYLPYPTNSIPHLLSLGSFLAYQLKLKINDELNISKTIHVSLQTISGKTFTKQKTTKTLSTSLPNETALLIKVLSQKLAEEVQRITISVTKQGLVRYPTHVIQNLPHTKETHRGQRVDKMKQPSLLTSFLFSPRAFEGTV